MITLTNEKGLICNPKSWDEIIQIPGYSNGIDPSKHKLKAIIGSYHLKDINCGLRCNTQHDKGYIAETETGLITNIGNICGQKYFGVDFLTFRNQHHRDLQDKNNRDLLFTFSFQLEDFESFLDEKLIGEHGASWIYKTSRELIELGKSCPSIIVNEVTRMVKSGTSMISNERLANTSEVNAHELSKPKGSPRLIYVKENIGTLAGLDVLGEDNNLNKLITMECIEHIKQFKLLSIDTLNHLELARWAKWINSIENTKNKIDYSIRAGLLLLTQNNLKPLLLLLKDNSKESKSFNNYLKKLPIN